MQMTRTSLILIAAAGSFLLLAGAFLFQALGWAPCQMCLWQRWPHAAAIAIGAVGMAVPTAMVALLGAMAALSTAAIGLYHSGVERKWWEGPSSCTGSGGDLGALSGDALLPGAGDAAPLVLCDSFEPFLFGLTMANWNALASLGLALIWVMAMRASRH